MKHHQSQFILCLIAVAMFSLSSFAWAESPFFRFEPTNKATAISDADLIAGDIVVVSSNNINKNEHLYLYRCGNLCNSAKLISGWESADLLENRETAITIEEPGSYYLWIQAKTEEGYNGPVFGESEVMENGSVILNFQSGTNVTISVKRLN